MALRRLSAVAGASRMGAGVFRPLTASVAGLSSSPTPTPRSASASSPAVDHRVAAMLRETRAKSDVCDFLVVGGGIVGINIAWELKKKFKDARVVLIEKEKSLSMHASGRNSGVLHAGFYYHADSLKAKLTRQGNLFLHEYCESRKLRINRCGKLVVARDEKDLAGLEELLRRGERNGVPLERVTVQQAKEIEPLVKTHEFAIWSPSTAAADPTEVTLSIAKDAAEEGVEFRTDTAYVRAEGALDGSSDYSVVTSHGRIVAGHLVNCAGLYADKVAHDFGFGKDLVVLPFKGLYLYCNVPLRTLVYPVPNLSQPFLGVHFTVTVDGKCKIGPTAIPAFWREQYGFLDHFKAGEFLEVAATEASLFADANFDFRGLAVQEMRKYSKNFMAEGAAALAEGVTLDSFTHYGKAGIRAQLVDLKKRSLVMDFLVEGDERSTHVLNAVSPAWTCSNPFAKFVLSTMKVQ